MQTHRHIGIEERFEKGQATNMIGVKMRKTNIDFTTPIGNYFSAQIDQARAAVKSNQRVIDTDADARCIAAKDAVIWCVHRH